MAGPSITTFYANNLNIESIGDLAGATIKMLLCTSSYTPNATATGHTVLADITNQLATGFGYTSGGATLANPTVAATAGNDGFKFSTDSVTWTATGGTFPAWRYGVIYVSGSLWGVTSPLLCYFTGDGTPADVPAMPVGDFITISCAAGGWFAKSNT